MAGCFLYPFRVFSRFCNPGKTACESNTAAHADPDRISHLDAQPNPDAATHVDEDHSSFCDANLGCDGELFCDFNRSFLCESNTAVTCRRFTDISFANEDCFSLGDKPSCFSNNRPADHFHGCHTNRTDGSLSGCPLGDTHLDAYTHPNLDAHTHADPASHLDAVTDTHTAPHADIYSNFYNNLHRHGKFHTLADVHAKLHRNGDFDENRVSHVDGIPDQHPAPYVNIDFHLHAHVYAHHHSHSQPYLYRDVYKNIPPHLDSLSN